MAGQLYRNSTTGVAMPAEIWDRIWRQLDINDLLEVRRVCKSFDYSIIEGKYIVHLTAKGRILTVFPYIRKKICGTVRQTYEFEEISQMKNHDLIFICVISQLMKLYYKIQKPTPDQVRQYWGSINYPRLIKLGKRPN